MTSETEETYWASTSLLSTRQREPYEKAPYVDTLHDVYVKSGEKLKMGVKYEADTNVHIRWLKDGNDVAGGDRQRSGETGMTIPKVVYAKHHGKTYRVYITDSAGRQVFTGGKVYVS